MILGVESRSTWGNARVIFLRSLTDARWFLPISSLSVRLYFFCRAIAFAALGVRRCMLPGRAPESRPMAKTTCCKVLSRVFIETSRRGRTPRSRGMLAIFSPRSRTTADAPVSGIDLGHDLPSFGRADPMDVLERDDSALIGWDIDASNACQVRYSFAAPARRSCLTRPGTQKTGPGTLFMPRHRSKTLRIGAVM